MKIKASYLYLLTIVWIGILAIFLKVFHLNVTGFGITLAFLTMIFAPGIFLVRIIRLKSDVLLLYIIGFGLSYFFFINLLGILLGLTIVQLEYITLTGLIVLGIIAFWRDQKEVISINFDSLKKKQAGDWILIGFIVLLAIIALWEVDAQSDRLIGDGWFHLAILEKIVSNVSLNPANLAMTKNASLNPVYSFPIWHILVGEFSRILEITIFTALKQVIVSLVILTMLVWYQFLTVFFKNKYLVAIMFLSFLLVFLRDNTYYFLIALASPDSFNRLFLLPLILGLTINFLYSSSSKVINVILISLLAIFMGLIHFTQLIYYILFLIFLGMLMAVFYRKKDILLKLGYLFGGIGCLILPYLLIIQRGIITTFLSANANTYNGDKLTFSTFLGANVVYRYAIMALLILGLFVKKNYRLLGLISIMVVGLLIYWPYLGFQGVFLKYFGEIFTSRALATIPHFVFFGLILYLVIVGLNHLFSKLPQKYHLFSNVILVLIFLIFMAVPVLRNFLTILVDQVIFNESLTLTGWNFYLVLILVLLVVTLFLAFHRKKEINLPEIKEKTNFALLSVIFIVILSLSSVPGLKKVFATNPNGSIFSNRHSTNASDISLIGGEKTIEFLKSVPVQSVFITSNPTFAQMVVLYSNNFVAEYPFGITDFTISPKVFDSETSLADRIEILDQMDVDYIMFRKASHEEIFIKNPEKFKKAFSTQNNKVTIYIYQYLK